MTKKKATKKKTAKKTELIASASPAAIKINFEEMRRELEAQLEKYNIVVTVDTVTDAKRLATELNKRANEMDAKRKEAIAKVSEPIKKADAQMKELIQLWKDGRARLLDQVNVFEDETRATAENLLIEHRIAERERLGIRSRFYNAEFDDLIKISSVTATGNLTAAARNELNNRVAAELQAQERYDRRLLELENRSYKIGLKAPLTLDHVSHFINADNETYERELTRILNAELERQERIERAERERQERLQREEKERKEREAKDAEQRAEKERLEAQAREQREEEELRQKFDRQATENRIAESAGEEPPHPEPPPTKIDRKPEPAPEVSPPSKPSSVVWLVTSIMRVECSARVTEQQVLSEHARLMKVANITTIIKTTAEQMEH